VQCEIEVGGRVRQVAVQRAGDAFEVTVDDRTWRVDAARIDANSLSLLVEPGARSYDVSVASDAATGLLSVRVGTTHVVAAFNGRRTGRESGGQVVAGPQRITAPMPGKIVRVAVNRGDQVRGRQTVVVIEAMKMENELKAARDGIVGELHANEGQSVEAGALLAVIQ
jgi:biotin carboxyl carrier protein